MGRRGVLEDLFEQPLVHKPGYPGSDESQPDSER